MKGRASERGPAPRTWFRLFAVLSKTRMILRDPVHGLVAFEKPEEAIIERLLEAREVQRLRRIRQLGLTSLAYPGADHTRFSHALGAAHVMVRFIGRMRNLDVDLAPEHRLTSERAQDVLAAALLHDVGHGPFSHLFETVSPNAVHHETWSERIVLEEQTDVHRILRGIERDLPERVARLIRGQHELPYLARAVSGTFDVDRADYLLRDAHFTGVSYGKFDLDWLLRSFCLGQKSRGQAAPSLAIDGQKGLPAIESFILARLFMFQQVYFHKASRASEWLLGRIFARLRVLLDESPRQASAMPPGLRDLFEGGTTSLGRYLALDDPALWTFLRELEEHADPIARDLSRRLSARRLPKTLELFGEDATPEGRKKCLDVVLEIAERRGLSPESYVGVDAPSVVAFEEKVPTPVRFRDGTEQAPSEVSFLLGRLRGETLSRPRILFADELRVEVERALGRAGARTVGLAGGVFGEGDGYGTSEPD